MKYIPGHKKLPSATTLITLFGFFDFRFSVVDADEQHVWIYRIDSASGFFYFDFVGGFKKP